MKIALYGAAGRMGRAICALAAADDNLQIVGAIGHHGSAELGKDIGALSGVGEIGVIVDPDIGSGLLGADVVIDFSIAPAFDTMLRTAMQKGVAVVSGTTRLEEASVALIDKAAATIPVLWAPNMSVGVQVLAKVVKEAVAALGLGYDVEIVEAHHNQKADAPSGTATFLQRAAQSVREDLEPVHGREGQVGKRRAHEIGMHAIRGGGVVGDHTVHLVSEFDRLELTHRAIRRELFAAGALRAARFVVGKAPGRYHLADVIQS